MMTGEEYLQVAGLTFVKLNSVQEVLDYISSSPFKEIQSSTFELLSHNSKEDRLLNAYCHYCDEESEVIYKSMPDYSAREGFICAKCQLNARLRMMSHLIKKYAKDGANIYMHEQVTGFYHRMQDVLPNCHFVGSEYFGDDKKSGEVYDGLRHEDVTNLSFEDETFDIIVSQDVFEHVLGDGGAAFKECYRVLKKNGVLLFTIPFHYGNETTVERAKLENGNITMLQPPVYHGNPVSEEGALVVNDFGWDITKVIHEAGFTDYGAYFYYGKDYGYMGIPNNLWIIKKT